MKKKCMYCGGEFERKKIIIGKEGFTHCPICWEPLFDMYIQEPCHWVWEYATEEQKRKFGYYDKLKEEKNGRA